MITEIGIYSLILAFIISLFITINPYLIHINVLRINYKFIKALSISQSTTLLISLICLFMSFVNDDFSLAYVTSNSHSSLPLEYKISAVWGGHEGSLLIYITCISFWVISFLLFSGKMPKIQKIRVLSIVSIFLSVLIIMLLFFSSPFLSLYPNIPVDGNDLNPLLQDKSMIIHPPMLYLGYVGFIIPFSISVVQLLNNKVDENFGKWIRPWIIIPWGILSLGIILGSYWAYYELGWGGFWFWDPVENASFMPWLTALALMHSVIVADNQRRLLKNVIVLSIITFFLSLLGTFLVRSGVVFSVHSFASDSTRGIYLLFLIFLFTIFISFLFYKKSYLFKEENKYKFFTKTMLINLNNYFIFAMMLAILFGTLYPLFSELFQDKVTSVGPNYFNKISTLIIIPIILLLILLPLWNWKNFLNERIKTFFFIIVLNLIISILFCYYYLQDQSLYLIFWIFIICSIINSSIFEFYKSKQKKNKISMMLGHIGFAILITGILIVSKYQIEKDLALKVGDEIQLNKFIVKFSGIEKIKGSNFVGHKGIFEIKKNKNIISTIYPEKRLFIVQEIGMSETAIYTNFFYDIYIAITTPLNDSKTWAVRVYYKPCVRFIWFGGIMISISSVSALFFFRKKYLN